ncbi:hypothetical protein K443DRAFT_652359 [Laccaria amethystina LaAM-08-1]|uniref:Uncharacterized protein n=1 Tax=Laccaria amethystina LaAM-08-1 TaxID=1095629 RepID=A0A0C9WHY7_9AGAR|nr:hypothetical protein K443DRAFT_652359 [Laccaria amethystina LaAM-08-1]
MTRRNKPRTQWTLSMIRLTREHDSPKTALYCDASWRTKRCENVAYGYLQSSRPTTPDDSQVHKDTSDHSCKHP